MIKIRPTKKIVIASWGISVLISAVMTMSGVMKVIEHPSVLEGIPTVGIPQNIIVLIGILELLSVILYLIPRTAVAGAIVLTGYMGGAILTHLRIGDPPVLQVLFPILAWFALFLRETRLQDLLPLVSRK